MATEVKGLIHAGSLVHLERQGCTVVTGAGQTIAVFAHDDKVYALDNRCPHMGFPLSQGTVRDGVLTCHWHHARFDLATGCTFDLFAGDNRSFPVRVVDGQVWVDPALPSQPPVEHWKRRLNEGLEHNIRLVVARSAIGMTKAGADYLLPLETGALFGARYSANGWSSAMSILTICANLLPFLHPEDRPLALYHGLFQIAQDVAGQPPRFPIEPLSATEVDAQRLKQWFRRFVEVRDQEAAERSLRTAIEAGLPPQQVADMVFAAITDHLFVDGGHTIDFANKAFELLDHIGWRHAGPVLTSLVPQMVNASRTEESSAWQYPHPVADLLFQAYRELPGLWEQGQKATAPWDGEDPLADAILGDDPAAIVDALKGAVSAGVTSDQLGAAVTYAAFLRVARFHLSNEFGDWNTVHHCLTTANAVHQALRRAPSVELLRGVFDTAMSIYQARFLNIPAAALPAPNGQSGNGSGAEGLLEELLQHMDKQQQITQSSRTVAHYLDSDADPEPLLATLGRAVFREDAGFHQFQMAEAALRQYQLRPGSRQGRVALIGAVRFLAAHAPTVRAAGQTYHTAYRLERGDQIFQDQ